MSTIACALNEKKTKYISNDESVPLSTTAPNEIEKTDVIKLLGYPLRADNNLKDLITLINQEKT